MKTLLLVLFNLLMACSFGQKKIFSVEYQILGVTTSNKAILQIADTFSNWIVVNKNTEQESYF